MALFVLLLRVWLVYYILEFFWLSTQLRYKFGRGGARRQIHK